MEPDTFIPRTKFVSPRVPLSFYPRRRLRDDLDAGNGVPLTVIVGVPGSGKTLLLADWAHHSAAAYVAWVSCDEGDADPRALWRTLVTSLSGALPHLGERLHAAVEREEWSPEVAASMVVNALAEVDEPVVVVLDDAQRAPEGVGSLSPLIERLPQPVRFVVASRQDPLLPLYRLRVRGQLHELRDADLRFTLDEMIALLSSFGLDFDDSQLEALHRNVGGWAAGIMLVANAARGAGTALEFVKNEEAISQLLREYVEKEVLEEIPAEVSCLLSKLAVLESFDEGIAEALCDDDGAAAIVGEIVRRNLFVERDAPGADYRLNPAFRRVLLDRLAASDRGKVQELHLQAARWFDQRGTFDVAVRHHVRAGAYVEALAAIDQGVLRGVYYEGGPALTDWLSEIDETSATVDPTGASQVLLAAGAALRGDVALGRRWLERVQVLGGDVSSSLQAHARLTEARLSLVEGDVESTLRNVDDARALQADWPDAWRLMEALLVGRARMWSGDLGEARRVWEDARRSAGASTPGELWIVALGAELSAVEGRLGEAMALAGEAMTLAATLDLRRHPALRDAYRARGLVHYEQGRLADAELDLERSLEMVEEQHPSSAVQSQTALCRVWLASGQVEEALSGVVRARRLLSSAPASPLHDLVTSVEVRADLMLGNLERAEHVAGSVRDPERRQVLAARVALTADEPDRAWALLSEAAPPRTLRARVDRHVLSARVLRQRGLQAESIDELRHATDLAEPEGLVRPFLEDGPDLWPTMRGYLRRLPRSPFVEQLRRVVDESRRTAWRTGLVRAVPDGDGPLGSLTARELEILQLLVEGASTTEISQLLHVSMNTVRTHVKAVYRKLGVHSRAQAVVAAERLGLS